jgi:8-oxo-dGTP diphosphatase
MPAVEEPVSRIKRLPTIYPITPDGPVDAAWWGRFQRGLDRGYRLVQLRVRSEREPALLEIVEQASERCHRVACALILNGPADWVEAHGLAGGLAGLHLPSAELMALTGRPVSRDLWLGASCHSLAELRQAEQIGADWACLSPLKKTQSHPGAEPLGLDTFSAWVKQFNLPVYALGGLGPDDVPAVRAAGGQGVAGISAFWT